MGQLIRRWPLLGLGIVGAWMMSACDDLSTLASDPNASDQPPASGDDSGKSGDDDNGDDDGGSTGDDDDDTDAAVPDCDYTAGDEKICECLGYNCGALSITDKKGTNIPIYCGSCSADQYCQSKVDGAGIGTCGGKNLLQYKFQKEKVDMLVATAEYDTTDPSYGKAENIKDGRGYSIGKVGFCTGTGDFIFVAACYNDKKPNNVLSKYWGTRDSSGKAKDGLIYYNDAFIATGNNQGDTAKIDSLGSFVADVKTAGSDPVFQQCQDDVADAIYLGTAMAHAEAHGFTGALTVGFLYDTELNFGEDDDVDDKGNPTPGAKSLVALADKDYGSSMPKSFDGKPWEESKWLGLLIKERAIEMAKDTTWQSDYDRNATWEAARRLHTAKTNSPETGTVLDMDYAIESKYKTGSSAAGGACWTGLSYTEDNELSVFSITTDKSAGSAETDWVAKGAKGDGYAACPANPTP